MATVTPFDWHRLFLGDEPPLFFLEIVVRVLLTYSFAVIALRYMGKRGQRQMAPFELVLVIALGSATGDAMFSPEVPILYAWLIIAVMVGLNRMLGIAQVRSKRVNDFLEGRPQLVLSAGRILDESLRDEHLRRCELLALLREQGVRNTGELEYVFLEATGRLGLLRTPSDRQYEGESTLPQDACESASDNR
jgi:uncharacterized membrane protein YcaP (DUF421 family)